MSIIIIEGGYTMKNMKLGFVSCLIVLLLISSGYPSLAVVESTYNFENAEFNEKNTYNLNGVWEFYPQEKYYFENFQEENLPKEFVNIPDDFYTNTYGRKSNENLPNYGTLRTNLVLGSENIGRKLYIQNSIFSENCNIWIDGKLVVNSGVVADDKYDGNSTNVSSTGYFYVTSEEMEVVIHYSHFYYGPKSGDGIVIGTEEAISSSYTADLTIEVGLVTALMVLVIYHFMFYIKKERKTVMFFFLLFVIVLMMRVLNLGNNTLATIFQDIQYTTYLKISFISYFLLLPTMIILSKESKYLKCNEKIILFLKITAIIITSIVITFDWEVYSILTFPVFIMYMIILGYVFLENAKLSNRHKNAHDKMMLLILLAIAILIISDYGYQTCQIFSKGYLGLGILGFILIETISIEKRFSEVFNQAMDLGKQNKIAKLELDKMSYKIEDLAEKKVIEFYNQNLKLQDIYLDLNMILNNMNQSIFIVGKDQKIDRKYNNILTLRKVKFDGNISQTLFYSDIEKKLFMDTMLCKIFEANSEEESKLYIELLPGQIFIIDRYYSADYVYDYNEKKIIILLEDRSNQMKVMNEIIDEKNEAEMLLSVALDKKEFTKNLILYQKFCKEDINSILEEDDLKGNKILAILTSVHTFKGIFNKFHMNKSVKLLNALEMELLEIQSNEESMSIDEFAEMIADYDLESITDLELKVIRKKIKNLDDNEEWTGKFTGVKTLIKESMGNIEEIAMKDKKEIYPIEVEGDDIDLDFEKYYPLFRTFNHIFANAIDHGIENTDERIKLGKDKTGKIEVLVSVSEKEIGMDIIDDGRGIDVNMIKEHLYNNNSMPFQSIARLKEWDAIQHIFDENFTTQKEVSDSAGRGVGLSAVKSAIEKYNGSIEVESEIFKYTKFKLNFPINN